MQGLPRVSAGLRLGCQGERGNSGLSLLPHHQLLSVTAAREDFCPTCLLLGKKIVGGVLRFKVCSLALRCFYKARFCRCEFNSPGQKNDSTGQRWHHWDWQHFCRHKVVCCGLDEPDGSRCAQERRCRASSQVVEQLRVRGGNGSQKSCSPRESLGISHSPVTPGLCIYLAFRWL